MTAALLNSDLIQSARQVAAKINLDPLKYLESVAALENATAFIQSLGEVLHYDVLNQEAFTQIIPDYQILSYNECEKRKCILFFNSSHELHVIFSDIFDDDLFDDIQEKTSMPFKSLLAYGDDILKCLNSHQAPMGINGYMNQNIPSAYGQDKNAIEIESLSNDSINLDTNQVVKIVRTTLFEALNYDASDIHMEMGPQGLTVRFRFDGILNEINSIHDIELSKQIISRIKIMAELDITEQRIPQDGRFRAIYKERDIDFRVSVMPSIHGEDIVIRVLDKKTLADDIRGLRLDFLGFDETSLASMRKELKMPHGMFLVTGPTGSGKTTTLYAAISEINSGLEKIITIEDPIEYQLNHVLQIPVNEKKGLTFARGLRSILRHDPDKIMVGEIRDNETAQIAIQSALTGHLVFTTVHANNAFDVIGRFLNMGVDPYSFVSALNVVVAQRLLRKVCHQCATEDNNHSLETFGIKKSEHATLKRGQGCAVCRGSGYKGRTAIAEILHLNDELREMIASRSSIKSIKECAHQQGTKFLHQSALEVLWRGETTIEEVMRVAPSF